MPRIPVPASMQAPEREWGSAMNPRIKYFAPSQRSTILQIRAASAIQDKTSTATRVRMIMPRAAGSPYGVVRIDIYAMAAVCLRERVL